MMRKIKMTNAELDTMRLSRSTSVKDMFSADHSVISESQPASASTTYDTQKDIVELVMINEMLTNFLAMKILPRFKKDRCINYKKIMAQFSKMERMNSKNVIIMWQSIMHFHSEKSQQQAQEMAGNHASYSPE